ncbi:MAG: caspase family protein, partial [Gammaproteobacteria bacterium]|nr:caspase family protein [Gammaproteobacteria bacterium]
MQAIAAARGFETTQLKTADATRKTVESAIISAANTLKAGDMFLVSYSGHGGLVRDVDGDEADGKDDTWCLYDAQFLDDELRVLLAGFAPGVRVLVISDSCHSGTMLKGEREGQESAAFEDDFIYARAMPLDVARSVSTENRSFYGRIQDRLPHPKPPISASVRLLSGCLEHEKAYGNKETGRFTASLKTVYADGAFKGGYSEFHRAILETIANAPKKQTPGHAILGVRDPEYDRQPPFQI